jgi:hypothetical protein
MYGRIPLTIQLNRASIQPLSLTKEAAMKVKAPLISDRERFSLLLQGMDRDLLKGAFVHVDTGNWENSLPKEISAEDMARIKGVVASMTAGITRLILIAIAQDFVSFRGFQNPHLLSLIQAMEEVGEDIGFEAWAMENS